jgi:hypothetical protein
MGLFDYASQGFQRVAPHKKQVAGMTNRSPPADTPADSPSRDDILKRMLKMKPAPHKTAVVAQRPKSALKTKPPKRRKVD